MKFICDFIPNLFGWHVIYVISFGISTNTYRVLWQFLFLTLSFQFLNENEIMALFLLKEMK
jgi:hypothetical protein